MIGRLIISRKKGGRIEERGESVEGEIERGRKKGERGQAGLVRDKSFAPGLSGP